MYLIWTAPGGQHFAHGDGARGRKAGYQARYVMKVGGNEGSTGSIYLRMAGEERCIQYHAAYIMDPATGSLPHKPCSEPRTPRRLLPPKPVFINTTHQHRPTRA